MVQARRLTSKVQSSLWFIPVLCVLIGAALSFSSIAIDEATNYDLVPSSLTGGPDAALQILSTIAASMVSLAALVLTITMVVVQLAMGQFSPRIVQTFLRDKPSQIAVGLFIATFVHAMLTLREVRFAASATVPGLSIGVAYVLVVISVVVLVLYIHHIGRSLRVSALIELVGSDTRALLDREYPAESGTARHVDEHVIVAPKSGVVTFIEHDRLVARAADRRLHPAVGPAARCIRPRRRAAVPHRRRSRPRRRATTSSSGSGSAWNARWIRTSPTGCACWSTWRSARSPIRRSSIPTTAVQAIDRLHDCLRQIAQRELPDGRYRDDRGRVRLIVPVMDWDAYLHLAFDEIRIAGAGSPQVSRRLTAALQDLETVVSGDRLAAVRRHRELLSDATNAAVTDADELDFALRPDRQGIGVRAGALPDHP